MVGLEGKEESLVVDAICYVASLFVGIHTHQCQLAILSRQITKIIYEQLKESLN